MSQKCVLAQEIRLGSPDHSPRQRVRSGDEIRTLCVLYTKWMKLRWPKY